MKFRIGPFICLLLLGQQLNAQKPKPSLQNFYNENTQSSDLINQSGDTLYSGFRWFSRVMDKSNNVLSPPFYWMAKRGEKTGWIDDTGTMVLPFEFDKITHDHGKLICYKNDSIEVHLFSGELIYEGNEYSELIPFEKGYVCMKNGKKGFLDNNFNLILSAEYDHIVPEIIDAEIDRETVISDHVFIVIKDKKLGVYDFHRGIVVPVEYKEINVFWIDQNCSNSPALYRANDGKKTELINEFGKVVFIQDSGSVASAHDFYFAQYNHCGAGSIQYAAISDRSVRNPPVSALNIQTGELSKEYDFIWFNENRLLFKKGDKWGILNEQMKEMASWKKMNATWEYLRLNNFDAGSIQQINRWSVVIDTVKSSYEISAKDNLVIIWEEKVDSLLINDLRQGLYNYVTKKKIPAKYDDIVICEMKGEKLFLAYVDKNNPTNESGNDYTDIYDANFKLIKTGTYFSRAYLEGNTYNREISDQLFYESKNGQFGLSNGKGEIIVPAVYSAYTDFTLTIDADHSVYFPYYWLKKDSVYGAFNVNGELMIPFQFERIEGTSSALIGIRKNNKNALFDLNGVCILDSVDSYYSTYYLQAYKPFLTHGFSNSFIVFLVKGNSLYFYQDGKLKLVDEHTFIFSKRYLQLHKGLVIDQNGTIIQTAGYSAGYEDHPQEYDKLPEDSKIFEKKK